MKRPSSHYGTRPESRADPKKRLTAALTERLPGEILTYLAGDPARLQRFFDITGLGAGTLRQAAAGPGFGASLLDYLGSDENLLRDFAQSRDYDPAVIDAVRLSLADPRISG